MTFTPLSLINDPPVPVPIVPTVSRKSLPAVQIVPTPPPSQRLAQCHAPQEPPLLHSAIALADLLSNPIVFVPPSLLSQLSQTPLRTQSTLPVAISPLSTRLLLSPAKPNILFSGNRHTRITRRVYLISGLNYCDGQNRHTGPRK